ncbi:alpha/beta fold hydrolase [Allorhizocola rhizosphaerae]|uniref:alpha/beta fold hydrolase n=1 Tax=Allorhizocola rhizosphaerae TaxID=1872709 RepID=UPI0013C2EF1A|nr:alpha/beta hydrolase [Allorhizocola rhizosphaerae]
MRAAGLPVHVRYSGAGDDRKPLALFVHGHFGSSRTWSGLTALLSGQLECVAMDLPGFGRTPPPACYSTTAMGDTVAAVAEAISDEPVHVIGNSYGGTIALWLAATHPELVRSLTLISPAVSLSPAGLTMRKCLTVLYRLCAGGAGLRRQLSGKDARALTDAVLKECCMDSSGIDATVFDVAVADVREALRNPARITAESRSFRALAATLMRFHFPGGSSLRRVARRITVPTAIIWGEGDATVPVRHARRLARLIPGARLAVVRGTGHLPQLEAPQRVAAIIAAHIAHIAEHPARV